MYFNVMTAAPPPREILNLIVIEIILQRLQNK